LSHILRDLSEYATLAFIASFNAPQTLKQDLKPSSTPAQKLHMITAVLQQKQIMSIVFLRMFIPKVARAIHAVWVK
jgi:hypothetical protein